MFSGSVCVFRIGLCFSDRFEFFMVHHIADKSATIPVWFSYYSVLKKLKLTNSGTTFESYTHQYTHQFQNMLVFNVHVTLYLKNY